MEHAHLRLSDNVAKGNYGRHYRTPNVCLQCRQSANACFLILKHFFAVFLLVVPQTTRISKVPFFDLTEPCMSWCIYCGSGRTSDSLRAGRSAVESHGPGFVAVHTGPETYPVSCTVDTGSFPGVKWPERGAEHTPPSCVALRVVGAVRPPPLFAFTFSCFGIGLYSS
jgi:hypothetical protein